MPVQLNMILLLFGGLQGLLLSVLLIGKRAIPQSLYLPAYLPGRNDPANINEIVSKVWLMENMAVAPHS